MSSFSETGSKTGVEFGREVGTTSSRLFATLLLCLVCCLGLLTGCGGGSGSTPAAKTSARSGKATFTILWPSSRANKPSRVIPEGTQSILITLFYNNTVVGRQIATPPASGNTETVTLDNLPLVKLTGTAAAYLTSDATGSTVASAGFDLTIVAGTPTPITVSLVSTVVSVTITPAAPAPLIADQTLQLNATTSDANGSVVPVIPSDLQWVSDNPQVISVNSDNNGNEIATGHLTGTANITVTELSSGKSNTIPVKVTAGVVASLVIASPSPLALPSNQTTLLQTTIKDANGNTITVSPADLQWGSDNPNVVSVDANGNVTGHQVGTAHVTVTEQKSGRSAALTIIVGVGTVASVAVMPAAPPVLIANQILQLTALPKDAAGNVVAVAPANLQWNSTNTGVATVDSNGNVTGKLAGNTTITVKESASGILSPGVTVTVRVDVEINPILPVTLNQTVKCSASVTGASNTSVTWSVQEGTSGGSIDTQGNYTAPNIPGTYHIVATSVVDPNQSTIAPVTVAVGQGHFLLQ